MLKRLGLHLQISLTILNSDHNWEELCIQVRHHQSCIYENHNSIRIVRFLIWSLLIFHHKVVNATWIWRWSTRDNGEEEKLHKQRPHTSNYAVLWQTRLWVVGDRLKFLAWEQCTINRQCCACEASHKKDLECFHNSSESESQIQGTSTNSLFLTTL